MRLFLCCLALVLLPQCGGGAASAEGPKSAEDDAASAPEVSSKGRRGNRSRGRDEDDAPPHDAASSESSSGPSCDDGTCSKCGSGICPAGWYCDERVGGGACSWLAECAEKPTCGCVTRVLGASCKCREESGGLKVACE